MTISISPAELMERHLWDDFCRERGWSPYVVAEGRCPPYDEITLTPGEAKRLGLRVIVRQYDPEED